MNCAFRGDHCRHPRNHGFDYFYDKPFTLTNDCDPGRPPEVDAALRAQVWGYTQFLALGILTLAAGQTCGFFSVSARAVTGMSFLFFISWYSSFGFVRRWNCILMRNHDFAEQPMVLEKTASLMLKEAVSYIER